MSGLDHQAVLERAIQKAIDGGWTDYLGRPLNGWGYGAGQWHTTKTHLCVPNGKMSDSYIHYSEIIFNHAFAKALWGDAGTTVGKSREWVHEPWRIIQRPAWQFHLQHMVIAEDPLQYLADNLPE